VISHQDQQLTPLRRLPRHFGYPVEVARTVKPARLRIAGDRIEPAGAVRRLPLGRGGLGIDEQPSLTEGILQRGVPRGRLGKIYAHADPYDGHDGNDESEKPDPPPNHDAMGALV